MSDPVFWAFVYILIGALVWMLCEPSDRSNVAISHYCARTGRLPSAGLMVIVIGIVILLWPWLACEQLRKMRGVR